MKRFIASSLLALALTAALGGTATAVDPGSGQALEIAPPLVNLKADPGETIKTEIKIRDIAQTQLLVTGEVNDFTSQGEEGIPKVDVDAEERSPYSIIGWSRLTSSSWSPKRSKAYQSLFGYRPMRRQVAIMA